MRHLQLEFESAHYPVWLGSDCIAELSSRLLSYPASSYHLVTDVTVSALHASKLHAHMAAQAHTRMWVMSEGESVKSLSTLDRLAQDMVRAGIDRSSVIVAVGGGVVGNMAGLLAALLFRGIRLIHVPTTLIAAGDSVASLKQAVNLPMGKNLIGCFHTPTAVLMDIAWLQTLPAAHVRSGMCEIIKNALTVASGNIPLLEQLLNPEARYSNADLLDVVEAGLQAKQRIMRNDQRERQQAVVFEYGHTVGHAIELAAQGRLPHGEAVGLGMVVAAEVACRLGLLSQEKVALHRRLLARNGIALQLPQGVTLAQVRALLLTDNKRGYMAAGENQLAMILLQDIGQPAGPAERPLTLVDIDLVERCITDCLAPAGQALQREGDLCLQ
ncbi:iron-containing alcohol dehydrogenase [Mitsuaria sp. WAJ17]|uniref:iron-containing alcohol dehydrogenase n=1 Tax=Mitsuaria sp. WAJ17 TaxID=2761452 RepID=UPI0015FFB188|nr:iron-containing alcohol dehydrogenase [Mitsuaria sp. WAJ17]MBB2485181.1 iron-containing alcohol dehydrogenase [Mitsuaria sp. WAJ17]